MNNNLINEEKAHNIKLINREEISITGVKKINSLNNLEFDVVTSLGDLIIKGNDLEMKHLDVELGNLEIKGTIDEIKYAKESSKTQKKQSFLGKLFK